MAIVCRGFGGRHPPGSNPSRPLPAQGETKKIGPVRTHVKGSLYPLMCVSTEPLKCLFEDFGDVLDGFPVC